jgi:alkyl hydroperoxide reductase subunit AhpC
LNLGKKRREGGVGPVNKEIWRNEYVTKKFGFEGVRGTVIVNPEGKIVYFSETHPDVNRSTEDIIRNLKALQAAATGEVKCPVNWKEGDPTLKGSVQEMKDFLKSKYEEQ